ncbi:MAG TPA: flagellar biosynthetic protein FliR [Patescibacteria group bacterium]|nr:flagellar biosynthetic protein FliR [Patescibacteria group bacterium]
MQSLLNELVTGHVAAFLLIFMRTGLALMIMPGIGDSFVSPQIRLHFALGFAFILTPFLAPNLPPLPSAAPDMIALLVSEAFIGLFIGTVMRIMITALDTAGGVISIQSSFSNALVFNPMTATQGSVIGALYSITGVTLLFVTNLHHYMLASVIDSYTMFPALAQAPDMQPIIEVVIATVSTAFKIGVQLAMPFLIVGTLVQFAFGLVGRLLPQIQIFFLAMPVQILLSLVMLTMVISAGMLFWLQGFEDLVNGALNPR